jgi:hypothetical protein
MALNPSLRILIEVRRSWTALRRLGLVLVTLGAVLGCSKTMTIYTVPRHPEAEIYVNGQLRGKGSAQVKVEGEGELCSPRNMGVSARLGTCESHVEVRTQLNTTSVASGVALSLVSLVITLATQGGWWGIGSGMVLAAGGNRHGRLQPRMARQRGHSHSAVPEHGRSERDGNGHSPTRGPEPGSPRPEGVASRDLCACRVL